MRQTAMRRCCRYQQARAGPVSTLGGQFEHGIAHFDGPSVSIIRIRYVPRTKRVYRTDFKPNNAPMTATRIVSYAFRHILDRSATGRWAVLAGAVMERAELFSGEEIRSAVQSVCESVQFSNSPSQQAFLKFVTRGGVLGTGHFKAYTIAVDGLGRGAAFNPDTDASVRVTAIRVRRSLSTYYASQGADAVVVIEIPAGQYAPVYSKRTVPLLPPRQDAWTRAAQWLARRWKH